MAQLTVSDPLRAYKGAASALSHPLRETGEYRHFLGENFHPNYQGEMGNNFNTRIQGTRIKHQMGKTSIKMYDKFGIILRIETSTNDVTEFQAFYSYQFWTGLKN